MMCFQDRSFCADADECKTAPCPFDRRFTKGHEMAARRWWGKDGEPPVAFMPMADKCEHFEP